MVLFCICSTCMADWFE